MALSTTSKQKMFQSTLPRGERRGRPIEDWMGTGFNPRSRVGSDVTA